MRRTSSPAIMVLSVVMSLLFSSTLFAQLPAGVVFNNYQFYCQGVSANGNYSPPSWSVRNISPDKENFDINYFGILYQWGTSVDLMGWSSTTTDAVLIGGWRGATGSPGYFEYESVETTITGLTPGVSYEYSLEAAANVIGTYGGNPAAGSSATSATFEVLFDGVSGGAYLLDPQNPVAQVYTFCFTADADGESVVAVNAGNTHVGGVAGSNPWVFILGSTGNFTLAVPDCNVVLPVELTGFTANMRPDKESVNLRWTTANEVNNDFFVVESSEDMIEWNDVVQVEGNGNHNGEFNYSEVDYSPYLGTTYYRLKQVDFDGETSYSHVVSVIRDQECYIQISPNPCEGVLQLRNLREKEIAFELCNVNGELVQVSQLIGVKQIELKSGVYVLRYYCGNQFRTEKIVVR